MRLAALAFIFATFCARAAEPAWLLVAPQRVVAGEPFEVIVVAPVDISSLRHERQTRSGHHMLAHLRTEAYPLYRRSGYPPRENDQVGLSYVE